MPRSPALASVCISIVATVLELGTGCSGPSHDGPPPGARAAAVRPIALRGEAKFFDQRIEVVASLGRRGGGGGPGGGGPGGGRHRARSGGHEEMGGPPPGGGDGPPGEGPGGGSPVGMRPASLPVVELIVRLTNVSKDAVDVQIRDVKSDLGNFAVRPEHLLLAPEQSSELDPMFSQLADVSYEIPVTVTLRLDGKIESHDIALHTVETAREAK